MNKRVNNPTHASVGGVSKPKERHIVSWSQEEDDILREQIRVHGTENWAIIASNFKGKTTRQCRRRWFTYLNSDFKKGGWSPEEDMLLCEAQKLFGNRWTEIAKVVSGRTDNAVKNRFTTLCKRRAKHEALAKENSSTSYINLNNKRGIFPGRSDSVVSLKKLRTYTSNTIKSEDEKVASECDAASPLRRHPLKVVAQNVHSHDSNIPIMMNINHIKRPSVDETENNKIHGTFLKKDDPKVLALIQQAELLSSLAIKVNSEKTDQSLESAWVVLQNTLRQNKESDLIIFSQPDSEFQLEKCKELEDLRSSNDDSVHSWREPGPYESSPASSEYSTGSTLLLSTTADIAEEFQVETCALQQETRNEDPLDDQQCLSEESGKCHPVSVNEVNMVTINDLEDNSEVVCEYSNTKFSSPLHMTPLFRAMAATIPSPKFSESEKHFLMKTLGMESNSPSRVTNPSQPPPCKRSLRHCL